MAEETIWTLEIDSSGAIESLDELVAAFDSIVEQIGSVVSTAGDLVEVEDIIGNMSVSVITASENISEMAVSLDTVTASADATATAIEGVALSSQDASLANEQMTASSGSAVTGLSLIGIAGLVMGKNLYDAGTKGADGINLVQTMAGASTGDIELLEQAASRLGLTMTEASAGMYNVESAGYQGADAIKVLTNATEAAKANQTELAPVTNALTSIMHAYNATADESTMYTDQMTEAVVLGKQQFGDFASAIGPLAATGHNVGLSFAEIAAAEATMTQINPNVKQDTNELNFLFTAMDMSMQKVANTAKSLNISFDETKYQSLDLTGKLQYLADISGGTNTVAFSKLVGGTNGVKAALDLLSNNSQTYQNNLKTIGDSSGATATKFAQSQTTITAHSQQLGASISILATNIVQSLGPAIIPVLDTATKAFQNFSTWAGSHMDIVKAALAGVAVVIGGSLVAALGSLLATIAPLLPIIAAIGAVVGAVVLAFQHWGDVMKQVQAAMNMPMIHSLLGNLQQMGAYLQGVFAPIWQQLATTWQSQIAPALAHLQAALAPLAPALQVIGAIIGGVVIVALGLLVGVLSAVAQGLAGFLQGIIQAVGGVIQFFSGLVTFLAGILSFIVDLVSGNFGALGNDLANIWHGIADMFSGIWNTIAGIFRAAVGLIWGIISGFIQGIIGFFQGLWNDLVGHSIVPDMVNGIINWFAKLPGEAMSAVSGLASQLMGFFGNLANEAMNAGANIIRQLAAGIMSAIGAVGNAIGSVVNFISSHLPHSPAKIGPLKDLEYQGGQIIDQVAQGITNSIPRLSGILKQVTTPITASVTQSVNIPNQAVASSNSQQVQYLAQMTSYLAIIAQRAQSGASAQTSIRNSFSGSVNQQALAQLLQSAFGYNYESINRSGIGF